MYFFFLMSVVVDLENNVKERYQIIGIYSWYVYVYFVKPDY